MYWFCKQLCINSKNYFWIFIFRPVFEHAIRSWIVVFLGETGVGKSTLINSLFNHDFKLPPGDYQSESVSLDKHTYRGSCGIVVDFTAFFLLPPDVLGQRFVGVGQIWQLFLQISRKDLSDCNWPSSRPRVMAIRSIWLTGKNECEILEKISSYRMSI